MVTGLPVAGMPLNSPVVRAAHRPPRGHAVALGDGVLDGEHGIGESGPEPEDELFHAGGVGCHAGIAGAVTETGRVQLIEQADVTVGPHIAPPLKQGFASRHAGLLKSLVS
jgi:organic hydroperoxide reductase OsmC/OhrA